MATYAEAWNRFGETMLETTKRIAEINVRAGERLLEQQSELATQWFNVANRNVDITSKAMGLHEVFAGQTQIVQEYSQQLLQAWRRSGEIMSEASRQIAETVEQAARSQRQEGQGATKRAAAGS